MSAPLRITFGGYQGPNSVHTQGMKAFATALRELTGGGIEVELRSDVTRQGHTLGALLSMTEAGEIDACYTSSSYLSGRVTSLGLFDLLFAAPERERTFTLLDGALGARLSEAVAAQTGFAMLGVWDNGLRHISTTDRALHRPSDCGGLRLRTLVNDAHRRCFGALGFDARAIDIRDLPDAVATRTIDAQENPLTNLYRFGLHRTHRVVTLTGHLQGIAPVLFNRARLQSWPKEIRTAVAAAVQRASAVQRRLALQEDAECAALLAADGVDLVSLTDAERAVYRLALASETARCRATLDPALLTLLAPDTPAQLEPQP